MEIYFLKSVACLGVLMLFYKILLEKENMHVFKRFYLLGAVILSLVIPMITLNTYVEIPASPQDFLFEVEGGVEAERYSTPRLNFMGLFWIFYGLGAFIFGFKFYINLRAILRKINGNPKVKSGNITNVLLHEEITPHTFWNYIFINGTDYKKGQIPEEVFEHERVHAEQRHSLDILLIEFLQVVFWFHPLLFLVKRAIKLNHEFLADRAVIQKGVETAVYQETLLAFSSGAIHSSLVNYINYSSIKKRFTIMKTHTSKKVFWIKTLFLLPVIALLIYSCSSPEELETLEKSKMVETNKGIASPEMIAYYNKQASEYNSDWKEGNLTFVFTEFYKMQEIYRMMTVEQKAHAEPYPKIPAISELKNSSLLK